MRLFCAFAIAVTAMAVSAATPGLARDETISGSAGSQISVTPVAEFSEPWAMAFLPDGRMLVTEKPGRMLIVSQQGEKAEIEGVPEVAYGGQGGLGDVAIHPDFADNGLVYFSYAEAGKNGTRGAAVARAKLVEDNGGAHLDDAETIWRQVPKVSGGGHYSHRLLFSPEGKLFITSGERQKKTPAQKMDTNLGKLIRLNDDGSVPADNPFQDQGDLARTFWTIGHRNLLGIDYGLDGTLWEIEMGPRGGDELNIIEKGENYGWPLVSNGINYDGSDIPDHSTRPEFKAPEESWVPVISPSSLEIYTGDLFAEWTGQALISGLSSHGLVRVSLESQDDGTHAAEVERIDMGTRIRSVRQGPAGAVWVLEDGDGGRLLKLTPSD